MGQQFKERRTILDRYLRWRSNWRRWQRLFFPSPLEVRFAQIMRGHVLNIPFIKSKRTGFCLTFIWRGKLLKRELVHREVRAGKLYIDFAVVTPFYKRGIEVYSQGFHQDIVRDQEREDYLKAQGWKVMYVTSKQMGDPRRVYIETLRFLKS